MKRFLLIVIGGILFCSCDKGGTAVIVQNQSNKNLYNTYLCSFTNEDELIERFIIDELQIQESSYSFNISKKAEKVSISYRLEFKKRPVRETQSFQIKQGKENLIKIDNSIIENSIKY